MMESWARIFGNQPEFIVSCIGARAFVINEDAAFVVGTERMPGGEAVCTNVFCLESDGEWKLMHHQSGQGRGLQSTEDDAEKIGLDLEKLAAAIKKKTTDEDEDEDDDVVSAPWQLQQRQQGEGAAGVVLRAAL